MNITTILRSTHSTDSIYMFYVFVRKYSDCSLYVINCLVRITETKFTARYELNVEIQFNSVLVHEDLHIV
jgi:hypothetical protein